jgi:hypothetical protein
MAVPSQYTELTSSFRSQCVSDEPTDGTEDVGTPSFTRASLFVALVLLYFQPITVSIIFKKSAATPL